MSVAEASQRSGGDFAHTTTATIENDIGGLVCGQLVEVLGNSIEGNEGVGLCDFPSIGDVDVYQNEVLLLQHLNQVLAGYGVEGRVFGCLDGAPDDEGCGAPGKQRDQQDGAKPQQTARS